MTDNHSSWVVELQALEDGHGSYILRVATESGDKYEIYDVQYETISKLGDAAEEVERVRGTEEDPEISVGEIVGSLFGSHTQEKLSDGRFRKGEPNYA